MTTAPPTGTVTFLFTDIEGSTRLSQQYPEAMPALLARHDQILRETIEAHDGFVFQIIGDLFSAAFHSASDALSAALAAQRVPASGALVPRADQSAHGNPYGHSPGGRRCGFR